MNNNKQEKAKIYRASLLLQQKVGKGPLDEKIVQRAQKAIEENKVDFTPIGLNLLEKLKDALTNVETHLDPNKTKEQKQLLTEPVMELKANATIFHYSLVGNLANIMLSFLESIKTLDKDALIIVRAHHDTLKAIIIKKMRGSGNQHGQIFMKELKNVCARYYRKKKRKK